MLIDHFELVREFEVSASIVSSRDSNELKEVLADLDTQAFIFENLIPAYDSLSQDVQQSVLEAAELLLASLKMRLAEDKYLGEVELILSAYVDRLEGDISEIRLQSEEPRISPVVVPDVPVFHDVLGFDAYAQSVYELLVHKDTEFPISIAMSGPWGSGKTSLMRNLHNKFASRNVATTDEFGALRGHFRLTWIDVWKYSERIPIESILTREIYKQVSAQLRPLDRLATRIAVWSGASEVQWRHIIAKLLGRVLSPLGALSSIALSLPSFKNSDNIWLGEFDRLVHLITRSEGTLIVFVDNLDRCTPDRVLAILQSIHLLSEESYGRRLSFIFTMDSELVARSIRADYYESKSYPKYDAVDYGYGLLAKIFQIIIDVPKPDQATVESYVSYLLQSPSVVASPVSEPDEALVEQFRDVLREHAPKIEDLRGSVNTHATSLTYETRSAYQEAIKRAVSDNFPMDRDVEEAIRWGIQMLDPNPRDIKRFINVLRLQLLLSNRLLLGDLPRPNLRQIAKWTAMHIRWPHLSAAINAEPELLTDLEQLAEECPEIFSGINENSDAKYASSGTMLVGTLTDKEALLEILLVEPKLGDADLHGLLDVR